VAGDWSCIKLANALGFFAEPGRVGPSRVDNGRRVERLELATQGRSKARESVWVVYQTL
jgi:hypothetical protein